MKNILLIIMFVLCIGFVFAAESFIMTDLGLGSTSQLREDLATSTFRITNDGTEDLSMTLSSTIASAYAVQFSQNSVSLIPGAYVDVSVTVTVPDNQDSGRHSIGTITADSGTLSKVSTAYLTTKSELRIDKVSVDVDGDSNRVDDGEDVDAKPGDEVTISVTLENDYDSDVEIADINVEIQSDSDLDWDDDKDVSDIADGKDRTVEFSFSVDSDIDEEDYDVEIIVEGQDENGANHQDSLSFSVNVERKNHEILIRSVTLNPDTVSCEDGFTVNVFVENTGSNDEDEVSIDVENEVLDVFQRVTDISLDEGDTYRKTFSFSLPDNARKGDYSIIVRAYYRTDTETDEFIQQLTIGECTPSTSTSTTPTTPSTSIGGSEGSSTPSQQNQTTVIQPIVVPSGSVGPSYGQESFFSSNNYIILLVIGIVFLFIIILLLLIKFIF
jgi:uncharacterized membrane protein